MIIYKLYKDNRRKKFMKDSPYALKVKKIAGYLRVVMGGLFWITLLGMGLLIVAAIVVPFLSDDIFIVKEANNKGFTLSMDSLIRYRMDASHVGVSVKSIYRSIAWIAAFTSGGFIIILKQLISLLETVETDKPFAKENEKRLTIIGVILILGSIILRITGAMAAKTIITTLNITNLDININIDLFMAFTGFMMLILAGIFKYGNYLQEEYDSTL